MTRRLGYISIALASGIFSLAPFVMQAQVISFRDASASSGVDQFPGAIGVSAFDFNRDGWDDLTLALDDAPPLLLVNNQDNTFSEFSPSAGFSSEGKMIVPAWIDVNNDHRPDLFMGQFIGGATALYVDRGDGTYVDRAAEMGLDTTARLGTAAFGDFNKDGFLDVFFGVTHGADKLYLNREGLFFEDVSQQYDIEGDDFSVAMQASWVDFDDDGDLDLFVMHDEMVSNRLYLNNGGSPFLEEAARFNIAQVGVGNSMGLAWGDPDSDGHLDAYVTRILTGGLYMFDGSSTFTDEAVARNVALNGVSWGVSFADFDNDSDEDLAIVSSAAGGASVPPSVFSNQAGMFEAVYEAGEFEYRGQDKGLAVGDFNNDGLLDVFLANTAGNHRLMLNNTIQAGEWLTVELRGVSANSLGIGARMELDVGETTIVRLAHASESYNSQNSSRIHFGLGGALVAEELRVYWGDGSVETVHNMSSRTRYVITQGLMPTDSEESFELPVALHVEQPYPNPARTEISFTISSSTQAPLTFQVWDMLGRQVYVRSTDRANGGNTRLTIPVSDWSHGMYVFKVTSVQESRTGSFVVDR